MEPNKLKSYGVRLTHIPTNIVVNLNCYRSTEDNHKLALKVLRAKLFEMQNPSNLRDLIIEHGSGDYLLWNGYDIVEALE